MKPSGRLKGVGKGTAATHGVTESPLHGLIGSVMVFPDNRCLVTLLVCPHVRGRIPTVRLWLWWERGKTGPEDEGYTFSICLDLMGWLRATAR